MKSRPTNKALRYAIVAPAAIASLYLAGLATVVVDVHLFDRALLERAPNPVREVARTMYGGLVAVDAPTPFVYHIF